MGMNIIYYEVSQCNCKENTLGAPFNDLFC